MRDAAAIQPPFATIPELRLRPAGPDDCERVWQLNNDPTSRAASRSPRSIPLEEHQRWYDARLADPNTLLALIDVGEASSIGVVRVERAGPRAEISIAIDAAERGRGIGTAAVRAAVSEAAAAWPDTLVEAWIAADNRPSQRCFLAAGFVLRGLEGGVDHVFLRYTFDRDGSGSSAGSGQR